ncbi:ATPase, AAA-4 [Carpediemonas membranifera]|uniref:ATPase, AAA-4 n=1 Tax=Carpediemonas membranifera TaxID=201153 RepID=A0A8J6E1Y3_9EUKA|nr:ATPase, AAA-4 [Carpediemonas membranifera]|eukprot:KAG9393626.1 ATPase, AAA-4 [Carpediemonas membranifera]
MAHLSDMYMVPRHKTKRRMSSALAFANISDNSSSTSSAPSHDTARTSGEAFTFRYDDIISFEEDRAHEFKAIQNAKAPRTAIAHYAHEYVNSFLNSTEGGAIFFGVEDDGTIKGIPLNRHERDSIRLLIDSQVNRFSPQVDANLYETSFIPVIKEDAKPNEERYVVMIDVLPGTAPVYFTRLDRMNAYMRRDGGNIRMDRDTVLQRLVDGKTRHRSRSITVTVRPDVSIAADPTASPRMIPVIRDDLFVGRDEELEAADRFIRTNGSSVAVVCLHGLPLVGKSSLAHHIVERALSDGSYGDYQVSVDLKGISVRHASLHRSLLKVVLSLDQYTPVDDNTDVEVLFNIYVALLKGKKGVLLFENVGHARQDELSRLIPPALAPDTQCLVVVTSRKKLGLIDINTPMLDLLVDPLSSDNCGRIITMLLHTPLSPTQQIALSDRCMRLPMSIRLACQHLNRFLGAGGRSLERALADFLSMPQKESLDVFCPGFLSLVSALPPEAQLVLQIAAMLGPTFDITAMVKISTGDQSAVTNAVVELEENGLLRVDIVSQRMSLAFGLATFADALPAASAVDLQAIGHGMVRYYTELYTGLDVCIHEARATVSDKLLPINEAFSPSDIDCSVLVLGLLSDLGSSTMVMRQPEKRLALLYHMFDYDAGNAEQCLLVAQRFNIHDGVRKLLSVLRKYDERVGSDLRRLLASFDKW